MIRSQLCDILGIEKPIFQGGMAWIADANLAAAVSNAGGLGLISSINAGTEAVRAEIRKARTLTDKPFGVNIMLAAPNAAEIANLVVEEGVTIVTTGAGSPAPYMDQNGGAGRNGRHCRRCRVRWPCGRYPHHGSCSPSG